MRLRYKSRTFLVLITCVCIATGLVSFRGYWLLRKLEVDGSKATWHALLSFNGLDAERSSLRGKPIGVWRTSDSPNSVTWLLTEQHALTAVAGNGKIRDFGGIPCYGAPMVVWTGVTPDGNSSIILVSNVANRDNANYVLFVSLQGKCKVRRMIVIYNHGFETRLDEYQGWPTIEMIEKNASARESFSFPECNLPSAITQPSPWWRITQ